MALAAGAAVAWLVTAMGPAGRVTAATTDSTTSPSGGAGLTRTETKTVTEPARTDTVTETSTEQSSSNTPSVSHHTSVQVTPVAGTTSEQSSGSGMPAWGWVLIGVGAVLAAVAIFMVGRHSGKPPPGGAGTPGSPAPS